MAFDATIITDQDLISRLSHQPYETERHGMIRMNETPKPSTIARNAVSSIAHLDMLPPELIHSILNKLDFQSLSRFSQTSLYANSLVQSMPAHHELMEHAPQTLAALGHTRLIAYHSAATVRAALRSRGCISCGEYGPYLFLLTCHRCCWWCLLQNQALWAMPYKAAKICFGLSSQHLDQLPTMLSIPGFYSHGRGDMHHKKRRQLVCVGEVKRIALRIHGSEPAISELAANLQRISENRLYAYRHYQAAALEPLGPPDPVMQIEKANPMIDPFGGVASICFTSLGQNGLENGLWCLGCGWLNSNYRTALTSATVERLVDYPLHPGRVFRCMYLRGRSQAGFLDHIKHCLGGAKNCE